MCPKLVFFFRFVFFFCFHFLANIFIALATYQMLFLHQTLLLLNLQLFMDFMDGIRPFSWNHMEASNRIHYLFNDDDDDDMYSIKLIFIDAEKIIQVWLWTHGTKFRHTILIQMNLWRLRCICEKKKIIISYLFIASIFQIDMYGSIEIMIVIISGFQLSKRNSFWCTHMTIIRKRLFWNDNNYGLWIFRL